MPRIYVAIDLEFTGLDLRRDEIIEIGMVKFQGDKVLDTFSSLVKTKRRISYKIEQLVGITQRDLADAPAFAELRGQILAFVAHHPLVGHSIEMDLRFLQKQRMNLQNVAIDTFELASILVPEAKRYSLASLAELLEIKVDTSHRALADAMTTSRLFDALWHRAEAWDPNILRELTQLGQNTQWPPLQVFRDILADQVASRASELLRAPNAPRPEKRALRKKQELPPLEPTDDILPLNADALAKMIEPGGVFEKAFAGYEHRPQQVEMMRGIVEAFNLPTHLMVEAGTGTGKSLAYLLPSATWAMQNGRRVIISSNTINLQDQLYTKDVPDLRRVLHADLAVAQLKGRGNYLCLRRLRNMRRSRQLSVDETRVLAKVLAWLPKTDSGDRTELLLINKENQIWSQIQASSETCLGEQCPYRQSGECFFYNARARAERAHLVIINHALLLSDLMLDNRILPEYTHLIIDEAHHLEEQATNQFSLKVGRQDVFLLLNALSRGSNDAPGGLLGMVPGLFAKDQVLDASRKSMTSAIEALNAEIGTAQMRLGELFATLEAFLEEHGDGRGGQRGYDDQIRLGTGLRVQPDWTQIEIAWENLSAPLRQVSAGLEKLITLVEGLGLGENAERDEMAQELKTQLQRGQEMWQALDHIIFTPDDNGIYWISRARRTKDLAFHSAPLHVGPTLEDRLFSENECVVLTSATLRTANSFRFMESRLGLDEPIELALDSPFDMKSAVLLYVPKDMPEPSEPFYQKQVENSLIELVKATEGRTLILFTSNSQLYTTYYAIQPALDREGIVVYGQGIDGSRRQIVENFRSTERSVLLGTRSFWEGVDIVGQALSCLVITRLPFAVPTDPIFSARAETFDSPFDQFYLPDAILRFRQGFGRLIRSHDDYGVVVLLDKRLLTRSYGRTILRSLPPCTARQGPLQSLPQVALRWLDPSNRQ